MYSRSQDRSESAIRIPEHYSGCAFANPKPQSPKNREEVPQKSRPRYPEAAKPSPPPKPQPEPPISASTSAKESIPTSAQASAPPPALLLPPIPSKPKEEHHPSSPKPLEHLLGNLGSAFPFSHGLGFDEILIIGLILLLARNGQDSDMILWLALLLFCG